jgi:hypothetical protein
MNVHESHSRYEHRERPTVPETEFTLSAFGLPEHDWVRQQTTPWFIWFGVAGIACLILAAGARWVKRQQAAA